MRHYGNTKLLNATRRSATTILCRSRYAATLLCRSREQRDVCWLLATCIVGVSWKTRRSG